jgi:hypothetical protein
MTRSYLRAFISLTVLAPAALVVSLPGCGSSRETQGVVKSTKATEDPWPKVVAALRNDTDPQYCQQQLIELNGGLATNESAERPAVLSNEDAANLATALRLNDPEKKLLTQSEFTAVDGNHLAECLYFRDVANSLGVTPSDPAVVRATVAFRWVCRQVVLSPWIFGEIAQPPVPPAYVLRRGSGSGLERAFVFLALCRQLQLDAYLIGRNASDRTWSHQPPGKTDELSRKGPFWGVGVRDGKEIRLYDPWRGEPVPSSQPDVPATLAEVRANPKGVSWLDDKQNPWEVTAEDLTGAEVYLSLPLSALTGRMATLDKYLGKDLGVAVAVNGLSARKSAESVAGGAPVLWWNPPDDYTPVRMLHGFLPVNQGGFADEKTGSVQFFKYIVMLIPRDKAVDIPPDIKHQDAADRLKEMAIVQFSGAFQTSPSPREKIQRGKHFEARSLLVQLRDNYTRAEERVATAAGTKAAIALWVKELNARYDALSSARGSGNKSLELEKEQEIAEFWKKSQGPIDYILSTMLGRPGSAEATYLLAFSFHERAEQAEVEATKSGSADSAARSAALDEWKRADQGWKRYAEYRAEQDISYPGRAAHTQKLAERASRLAGSGVK